MRRRSSVRIRTKRIIDRLTYEPEKHKQKFVKDLRDKLSKKRPRGNVSVATETELKIGAMNVQGLDGETNAAITDLINDRGLDVSKLLNYQNNCTKNGMNYHGMISKHTIFFEKKVKFLVKAQVFLIFPILGPRRISILKNS